MAEYGGGSHTSDEEDDDHSGTGGIFMVGAGMPGDFVRNRKRRGRPPGSKNKPKPPIVISRDSDATMRSVVLELPAGSDIVDMVSQYSCRRHVGLCVLSCSGTVVNVNLRLPVPHATTFILPGIYNILSLSATFLGSSASSSNSSSSTPIPSPPIAIFLAGPQGQVFGGTVAGSLIAASNVVLVAVSFVNPSFQRFTLGEEEVTEIVKQGGGSGSATEIVKLGGGSGSATDTCMAINTSMSVNTSMSMNVHGVQNPDTLNSQISPDIPSWPSTTIYPSHYYQRDFS